jgi:hypothetical protein
MIGQSVRNSQGEQIGDVNDLVVDSNGQIKAVVIGVGGFLGLGEREVAVSMSSLQMQPPGASGSGSGSSGTGSTSSPSQPTMVLNATRDTLKEAPRWSWNEPSGSSSGSGSGSSSGGTSGGSTTSGSGTAR